MEREGSSITEGIGQGRITDNLAGAELDGSVRIPDEDSIAMVCRNVPFSARSAVLYCSSFQVYHLLAKEGLFVGASSALNVVAAVSVARSMGPGNTIVTILCDGAARYQSRLFSKAWLESRGLYDHVPVELRGMVSMA
jgi:cysteine synthase